MKKNSFYSKYQIDYMINNHKVQKWVLFMLLFFLANMTSAQEKKQIWNDEKVFHGRHVILKPYISENNIDGISVIICPGGSYFWLGKRNEGSEIAKWLQKNGITAFVLQYRVAGFMAYLTHYRKVFNGNKYPNMLNDAHRAFKFIKEHSEEYNIDPNKVGIVGFSAGGHLSLLSAVYSKGDENMPAFVGSIYPVVTMNDPYAHKRSRRALLSEKKENDQLMRDSLSLEKHISEKFPPVFIVNCLDDQIVDYHNSIMLDSVLNEKNINHKYIQYSTGGHGFGASETKGSVESRQWKLEFINWLRTLNFN